jgi:hypothetical protein
MAQQDPQYTGICWLRIGLKYEVPFILPQFQFEGSSSDNWIQNERM